MADDVEQDANEGKLRFERRGGQVVAIKDGQARGVGPVDEVAEAMATFLEQIDFGERPA